jgi:DNA gyrase subunit B
VTPRPTYQAILPLRGKVINSEKNRINKVLSNAEIQAIITAIGTGIGEEFDIAKLRYHRVDRDDRRRRRRLAHPHVDPDVPLPADAGAVERGHVYIAVPPLYRVKIGNQEQYVEKEAHLEELLVRERIKDFDVVDRTGTSQKLTEARWGPLLTRAHEFEGWSRDCAPTSVPRAADFVVRTGSSRHPRSTLKDVASALGSIERTATRSRRLESDDADSFKARVVERETSAATHITVPATLLASPSTRTCARRTPSSTEIVGPPPFTITFGKKTRSARRSASCAHEALELAKEASRVSRFKGLGEMNPKSSGTRRWIPGRACSSGSRSRTPRSRTRSSRR